MLFALKKNVTNVRWETRLYSFRFIQISDKDFGKVITRCDMQLNIDHCQFSNLKNVAHSKGLKSKALRVGYNAKLKKCRK